MERAGRVEERAEGTRERELRTKESRNLWTILVPTLSLQYGLPPTFSLSCLSENYTLFCLKVGWGWEGVHKDMSFILSSF